MKREDHPDVMATRSSDAKREQHLLWDIHEALTKSRGAQSGMEQITSMIKLLVPSDYVVACYPLPGQQQAFQWIVDDPQMGAYLRGYADFAGGDFLRETAEQCPNQVLCDQDVMSHRKIKRTAPYRRAVDMRMRLNRVMWVRGQEEGSPWYWGLIGYREGMRAFSDKDRANLGKVRGWIQEWMRHWCDYALAEAEWRKLADSIGDDGLPPRIAELLDHDDDLMAAALHIYEGKLYKRLGDENENTTKWRVRKIRKLLDAESNALVIRKIAREQMLRRR